MYAAYLRCLTLGQETEEKYRIVQLFVAQISNAFPALADIYFNEASMEDSIARFPASHPNFLLLLQLLNSEICKVTLEVESDVVLELALRKMTSVCKDLRDLTIIFNWDGRIPPGVIECYIGRMARLELLSLHHVTCTERLLILIGSLPNLRKLIWETEGPDRIGEDSSDSNSSSSSSSEAAWRSEEGVYFPSIKSLSIDDCGRVVHAFLEDLADECPLLELRVDLFRTDEDIPLETHPFPDKFRVKTLESLRIYFSLNHAALHSNIIQSVTHLSALRNLRIVGEAVMQIGDQELIHAVSNCSKLEQLSIHAEATKVLSPSSSPNRISLACIPPILLACPLLKQLEGSFDLDQSKFSMDDVSQQHQNLTSINFGSSYFLAGCPCRDNNNWISRTVAFIDALTFQVCDIALSETICAAAREEEYPKQRKRLDAEIAIFDQCVLAMNTAKRHRKSTMRPLTVSGLKAD
jgi:hypothetical protein